MPGYAALVYGFPLYLISFEWVFRSLSQLDATSFVGPAIAAAGLSILFPLTKQNSIQLTPGIERRLDEQNLKVVSKKDELFTGFIWLMVLIGFLLWIWSCSISLRMPSSKIWIFPNHVVVGLANYFVAVLISEVKARL